MKNKTDFDRIILAVQAFNRAKNELMSAAKTYVIAAERNKKDGMPDAPMLVKMNFLMLEVAEITLYLKKTGDIQAYLDYCDDMIGIEIFSLDSVRMYVQSLRNDD